VARDPVMSVMKQDRRYDYMEAEIACTDTHRLCLCRAVDRLVALRQAYHEEDPDNVELLTKFGALRIIADSRRRPHTRKERSDV
jgi:hypothetical protein